MNAKLSHLTTRWAIIGSIALATPWFVSRSRPPAGAPTENARVPAFLIGEVLNYRVDWQRYAGAGTAQLQVVDRGNFYGSQMWHFRAAVHTAEPVRALYAMDDQIDSYAQFAGLETSQYQEHFREFGKPQDTDVALTSPGEMSNARAPHVIVPLGTHDPVSAIYSLRATDWLQTPELRLPVYDGQDVFEMVAKRGERTEVQIAAGVYTAMEIDIRLFDQDHEIPDEQFKVWLADDARQTPILCTADLPIGLLRIELTSRRDAADQTPAGKIPIPPGGSSPPAGN